MFMKLFRMEGLQRGPGVKKKCQKTLILVFELIVHVQLPKHTFEIGNFFRILAHCDLSNNIFYFISKEILEPEPKHLLYDSSFIMHGSHL